MARSAHRICFTAVTIALAGVAMAILPPYPAALAIWSITAAGR